MNERPRHYAGHGGMTRVEARLDRKIPSAKAPQHESVTARLMGDPPPGRRAVDQPRAVIAKPVFDEPHADDGLCRAAGCEARRVSRRSAYCGAHQRKFCVAWEAPKREPRMITRGWGK